MSSNTGRATSSQYQILETTSRRTKLNIWAPEGPFFLVNTSNDPNTVIKKAQCRYCMKLLCPTSNNTLQHHADHCKLKNSQPESMGSKSGDGGGGGGGDGSTTFHFDERLCREMAAKMVIQKSLPFNILDCPIVTNWIQKTLQPRYQQVSRITLKRDAMLMWKNVQKSMKKYFKTFSGQVSLTTDVWSALHNLNVSYICITLHWMEPNTWSLCKRTIDFQRFIHPHDGTHMYNILMGVLREFGITKKVLSISFDNASNNTNCVNKLISQLKPIGNGRLFHTRCVCHIINLIVKSGLQHFKNVIDNFRSLITICYGTSVNQQNFKTFCKRNGYRMKKPVHDISIRWNSTLAMLNSIRKNKVAMSAYLLNLNNVNITTESDWYILDEIITFLEVFQNSTVKLSGVYYATSPIVLGTILIIAQHLIEFKKKSHWTSIVIDMQIKFFKYFELIPPVFLVASALHPAINFDGVISCIESIASVLDFIESKEDFIEKNTKNLYESFDLLYEHYNELYGPTNVETQESGSQAGGNYGMSTSIWAAISKAKNKKQKSSSSSTYDELAMYKATDISQMLSVQQLNYFDLLQWWKSEVTRFPVISAIAKDVLTVQASTVASESCFSISGRVLNDRRTRLTAESLQLCICFKDYLDGLQRIQDKETLEVSCDVLEDEFIEEGSDMDNSTGSDETPAQNTEDEVAPQFQQPLETQGDYHVNVPESWPNQDQLYNVNPQGDYHVNLQSNDFSNFEIPENMPRFYKNSDDFTGF